jgi:hypothetical protein
VVESVRAVGVGVTLSMPCAQSYKGHPTIENRAATPEPKKGNEQSRQPLVEKNKMKRNDEQSCQIQYQMALDGERPG